jgi:hypothetical protein
LEKKTCPARRTKIADRKTLPSAGIAGPFEIFSTIAASPAPSLQGTSIETSSSGEIFSISASSKFWKKKSYLAVKVYSYN